MKRHTVILLALLLAVLASAFGCGAPTKIETVQKRQLSARLALSRSEMAEERHVIRSGSRDTIRVRDYEGREVILMKAVKDEETGEMVANEVIDAAVITARFRNVAERHGRIDLRFEVIVPQEMLDSRWQLRFYPDMFVLEDSIRLEPVIITGNDYRKAQLRGYELYERYLRSIITDSTAFVDWRNLEIWISRNLPELYKFKNDTTFFAEEDFLILIAEYHVAELLGKTVTLDHILGNVVALLEVRGSACGYFTKEDLFCGTSAQRHLDGIKEHLLCIEISILDRLISSKTACSACRNDRNTVNLLEFGCCTEYDCVACFVISSKALDLVAELL